MGIKIALNHLTQYTYDRPVSLGPQVIRLRPAPHARAEIHSYSLKVAPEDHFMNWQQDPFGNYLARVVFSEKTTVFKVEVDLVTEVKIFNPFDFFLEDSAMNFPFTYDPTLKVELAPYLEIKESGTELSKLVKSIDTTEKATVDFLVQLNQEIHSKLKYMIRMEPGVQTCETTLETKSGSCRDMAWLFCQALRHFGLATRFTSGYLIQLKADEKSLDGPSGAEADFTDLHAWTEVYLPGAGWVGFDLTSGLITGEGHIPLCSTPNPSSAAAITGSVDDCKATLEHRMTVTRIHEDRRITKPYSEDEWKTINELGHQVDEDLKAEDVRLTMGGEPTFVSVDDRESNQWRYGALGSEKSEKANNLLLRLADHYAKDGLLQYGQGKWYPGEVLPRWSLGCFWRPDKEAIWKNRELIASKDSKSKVTVEQAQAYAHELAMALGVPKEMTLAAHEDSPFYLWQEGKLPHEEEILEGDLYQKMERERLRKLLTANVNAPVGYVLPIGYSQAEKRWVTNKWSFRTNKLLLSIGDSPLGLRLPLSSLPFVEDTKEDLNPPERDTFDELGKLPTYEDLKIGIEERYSSYARQDHGYLETDPSGRVRTALSIQPRDGFLYVFLPPLSFAENFLELISALEWVSEKLKMPVRIEGYAPPLDTRIKSFRLTPDPGVLEANVQPVASWDEQVELTHVLYDEARQSRLAVDKFLLDGRRVGTGGGNHIVLGGETPKDSPFLRRPDLLKSIIAFWQNHPSMSYLFSSLFVGPTSQHPRVDEARHESLYELEIAFKQIEKGKETSPWLVDRLLRNLLADITGNTHRTEICIDKLYNPEGSTGRLGLVEFRNFEMPPHPRMSLLQSLLIRALVSSFWKTPYENPLVRWGTQLHDQFMLPQFIWSDFKSVLAELKTSGYDFDPEWFSPLFEFRFPKIGSSQIGDIQLELRSALEPWPVMAEESYGGSVSRAVDSSVERLQVKVKGLNKSYHKVTCNGVVLPLTDIDSHLTQVSGVRFKAWPAEVGLHPNLEVQSPLTFDVVDTRYGRSIGGCTYHVVHPGGRNHETFPVNENEAEGRRLARFEAVKHTPGKMKVNHQEPNRDFPQTLDLRWFAGPKA